MYQNINTFRSIFFYLFNFFYKPTHLKIRLLRTWRIIGRNSASLLSHCLFQSNIQQSNQIKVNFSSFRSTSPSTPEPDTFFTNQHQLIDGFVAIPTHLYILLAIPYYTYNFVLLDWKIAYDFLLTNKKCTSSDTFCSVCCLWKRRKHIEVPNRVINFYFIYLLYTLYWVP